MGTERVLEGLSRSPPVRTTTVVAIGALSADTRDPDHSDPQSQMAQSWQGVEPLPPRCHGDDMVALAVILLIVGLILLFLGIFVHVASWLLWIGIIVLIIAIIIGLFRFLRRNV